MDEKPPVNDPDTSPDSADPNGPCPRCGRVAHFSVSGVADVTFRKDGIFAANRDGSYQRLATQRAAILECGGCHDRIVVIEDQLHDGSREKQTGRVSWEGIYWWPPARVGSFGTEVPTQVAGAYGEGIRCLSAGASNGAVAMFRTAMTWMVNDRGSPDAKAKGDLKDKVKQVLADGGLTPAIGGWVDHVRLYGNAGVHPDLFGDVSVEEAKDVSRLVGTLIELLYVTPATIARRQAERRP